MSGLYLHIPFCRSKCVYCDFNSYAGLDALIDPYVNAISDELAEPSRVWDGGDIFDTLYIGGGNPAMLNEALPRILKSLFSAGRLAPGAEVSIEMNPEDAKADVLENLRAAGVNRLSLGWQALDDDLLRRIGRRHNAALAQEALVVAGQAGYSDVSVDLIFGLPGQSFDDWRSALERVIEAGPEHISAYDLTIEPGTPLARSVDSELRTALGAPLPTEDAVAQMYEWTRKRLVGAGYEHYEISSFARAGRRCRHNLNYWYGGDYLGIGAGAHSHFQGRRWWSLADPAKYIEAKNKLAGSEQLSIRQRLSERLFLGLRLVEGVEAQLIERELGEDPEKIFAKPLAHWRELGLMAAGPRLALSPGGLALANEVMVDFV